MLPSLANRPPSARRKPVALVGSENVAPAPPLTVAGIIARIKAILTERSDSRLAQLVAGNVFLLRVGSALLALACQVLLARWMGSFEFGIYIYVWTWVLMIGALSDMGLSSAARRFIPEYTELKAFDRLRGFLAASRWLAFGIATAIGIVGAIGVTWLSPLLDHFAIIPLYLACVTFPIYGLVRVQAVDRNGNAGEVERNDREVIGQGRKPRHADRANNADRRGDAEGEPARGCKKSAQPVEGLEFGVFRNEAPRRRRQAHVGERADHQHPGPHIDVDAEFETAHPACEQDLAGKREQRAADPYQKNVSGHELRQPAVAALSEDGLDARDDARHRQRRRGGNVFGTDQRHRFSPRWRLPVCERRQHSACLARNR